jgi:peptidyl-prolyl cis-trans isomerase SDCCAG10
MQNSSDGETTRDIQLSVKEALSSKKGTLSVKEAPRRDSAAGFSNNDDDDEDDALFDSQMRQKIIQKGKELGDLPPKLKQNGTVTLYSAFSFDEFSQLNISIFFVSKQYISFV